MPAWLKDPGSRKDHQKNIKKSITMDGLFACSYRLNISSNDKEAQLANNPLQIEEKNAKDKDDDPCGKCIHNGDEGADKPCDGFSIDRQLFFSVSCIAK